VHGSEGPFAAQADRAEDGAESAESARFEEAPQPLDDLCLIDAGAFADLAEGAGDDGDSALDMVQEDPIAPVELKLR
jgi:hypothetical protein